MNFKLRYYQQDAINSIFNYFTEKSGNCVLAMPTGVGKSAVIAGFMQQVLGIWPKQRFLVLTHVKELVTQDVEAIYRLWPTAPVGIYSAGLKQRETIQPIIVGGIATVVNNVASLGWRDLLIIDEAHLLSPKDDSMYQKTIKELKNTNPDLKVIGLTATNYRLGQGLLTDSGLFTDICYDITSYHAFNRLVAEGYISQLISKPTQTELDVSNVGISNGDYSKGELQRACDKEAVTRAALEEAYTAGSNRHKWLIFASGVEHSEHISEMLNQMGISCAAVHSKMPTQERNNRIDAFKYGDLRAISNNNVLTTGFDCPAIDMIVMLRPTCSPGLWCLDEETEILTKEGFKNKDTIKESDLVATVNPVTMQSEYLPITGKIERNLLLSETYISFSSPQMDWKVTDKHRMLFRTKTGRKRILSNVGFIEASQLLNNKYVQLPVSGSGHKNDLPLTDAEIRFIGLFMTDGTLDKSNNQITIYQSSRYPEILQQIRKCFIECGFKLREHNKKRPPYFDANRFQVAKGAWKYLKPWLSKDFALPLMELSERQFDILLESIFWGDGQKQPLNVDWVQRSFHISTGNKTFAERLQQTALLNGYRANIAKSHVYMIRMKKQQWNVICKSNDGRNQIKTEEADNKLVWCIENANGTIFTRRNGKVVIMGNCQMLGRLTRPVYADGYDLNSIEGRLAAIQAGPKQNGLVLDFARNTRRLGPINDPIKPRKKGQATGDAPIKICEQCGFYNHASVRFCDNCGAEFIFKVKIHKRADTVEVMKSDAPIVEQFKVDRVIYHRHNKAFSLPSIRVDYYCGLNRWREWVCLEHSGIAGKRARDWWRQRSIIEPPKTVDEALPLTGSLRFPKRINVHVNKSLPEIISYEF